MKSLYVTIFCALVSVTSSADVIIIGAGVSGLGAARQLVNAGGHSVTVLEARNRTGGRTWTDTGALPNAVGTEVDKGASWIHGASQSNPIKLLADKFNLETFETELERQTTYDDMKQNVFNETFIRFLKVLNQVISEYGDDNTLSIWDAVVNLGLQEEVMEPGTAFWIADAIEFYISGEVDQIPPSEFESYIENYLRRKKRDTTGVGLELLGQLKRLRRRRTKRRAQDEGPELLLVNGYVGIVNGLIDGVDGETPIEVGGEESPRIILNSPVASVEYGVDSDKNPSVKVTTIDGTEYSGDYVIVTVPLGVLKHDDITFDPQLSDEKKAAIEAVGFGNVNKLMMEWDTSFWDNEDVYHYFGFLNDNFEERGMCNKYLNAKLVVDRPVLVTFMLGPDATESETLSDEDLVARAMASIGKKYPGQDNPTYMTRTKWRSDPYARGAYSFYQVGTLVDDLETLAAAACPMFFAGEHTMSNEEAATVHGAYNSGLRAADEVVAAVNNGCSKTSGGSGHVHKHKPNSLVWRFIHHICAWIRICDKELLKSKRKMWRHRLRKHKNKSKTRKIRQRLIRYFD